MVIIVIYDSMIIWMVLMNQTASVIICGVWWPQKLLGSRLGCFTGTSVVLISASFSDVAEEVSHDFQAMVSHGQLDLPQRFDQLWWARRQLWGEWKEISHGFLTQNIPRYHELHVNMRKCVSLSRKMLGRCWPIMFHLFAISHEPYPISTPQSTEAARPILVAALNFASSDCMSLRGSDGQVWTQKFDGSQLVCKCLPKKEWLKTVQNTSTPHILTIPM